IIDRGFDAVKMKLGRPDPREDFERVKAVRKSIELAARHANVFMKVSALAESAAHTMKLAKAPLDPAFYEPWLDAAWAAFGERRLLYGSNWPVSNKASSYADVLGIVKPYVDRKGPEAQRWFFAEAARAAYRWAAPDA
ncbi:MAG: amidohydrolase family protein, partial [Planctomycetia bacterium]